MRKDKYNRRKFLSSVGSVAAAGTILNTAFPFSSAQAQVDSALPGQPGDEYLFDEGLTYLNTGTLGPCRKETIEESMNMWKELESFPVKFYGGGGKDPLAEKTRGIAAGFFGCDTSEIMITNSTTSGMNAVAQGLRLKAGDHILITDQEHSGGLMAGIIWRSIVVR